MYIPDNYDAWTAFERYHNNAYHARCEICGTDILILPEDDPICDNCKDNMEVEEL